jgi:hypothetical protein
MLAQDLRAGLQKVHADEQVHDHTGHLTFTALPPRSDRRVFSKPYPAEF